MSKRLISEFVACVEGKLTAETAEQATKVSAGDVKGVSLLLSGLLAGIRRYFRKLFRRDPDGST